MLWAIISIVSCLLLLFGQTIQKEFPPCVFGFSPGEFPFPRYFPWGKSLFPPRISQFPKRETGPVRQFLRERNAGLQDLFFVSNGRTRYPIMTLRSVCFLQTKHTLAPSFLDLTDLAGGSLLAIYCACSVTDCKYAFNQPNEESRSTEMDTNTQSRKLELTTTKLMEKSGSRTTVFQLQSKNQFACQTCFP